MPNIDVLCFLLYAVDNKFKSLNLLNNSAFQILQILLGLLMVLSGILQVVLEGTAYASGFVFIGPSIWAGVFVSIRDRS